MRVTFWGHSAIWRRHQVSQILLPAIVVYGRQIAHDSFLARHSLLHELVELVRLDVLEIAVLTLAHEPAKDFFVGVLLSLLISQVESIARLLVKSCQSVGRVDEGVFQTAEVSLAGLAAYDVLVGS